MSYKEKIVIVGYGWVGQANALSLFNMGYDVYFFDVNEVSYKYESSDYGKIKRLNNVTDAESPSTWYLIAIGDKMTKNGRQNIKEIIKGLDEVRAFKNRVVLRSTVLPQHLGKLSFRYYLPEFLHQKYAVKECLNPHFFVIGGDNLNNPPSFLKEWERRSGKVFKGTPKEASYIKYLSNIWNALRIAFVNEFGNAVRMETGDEESVKKLIDFIFDGEEYLRYGKSYKGYCLPKDVQSFFNAHNGDKLVPIIKAIHQSNNLHAAREEENHPEWFSSWK